MRRGKWAFNRTQVIIGVKRLRIWSAIGYIPTLGEYRIGHVVTEAVFVEKVVRHVARKAYLWSKTVGKPIYEAQIYELALDEYFKKEDGIVGQITRARVRLERGAKGLHDDAWKTPGEKEYVDTIHALLQEKNERREKQVGE